MFSTMAGFLAITSLLFTLATAHTWNEQLAVIGSNGSYTGAYGYPRGYVARGDPGFYSLDYTIPQLSTDRTRANASDLLCHPAQRTQNQTANWPRLTVAPGSAVAMKYLENGHVSLPQNIVGKPPSGGTVFVFGTTQPYDDETLFDVMAWTKDGSGGDKRGYLLAANNYDDGRCHQINSGTISVERQQLYPDSFPGQPQSKNELWCETDVIMPKDTSIMPIGKLFTIYWVWQWPTAPGVPIYPTGKDEFYTTCSDFEVVAEEPDGALTNLLTQQDPNTQAVSAYMSRTAITASPSAQLATSIPSSASSSALPATTSSGLVSSSTLSMSTSSSSVSSSTLPATTSSALLTSAMPNSSSFVLQVIPITPGLTTYTGMISSSTTSTIIHSSSTSSASSSFSSSASTSSSSSRSMVTLTVTSHPFTLVVPSSTGPSTITSSATPVAPQVGSSGVLVMESETSTTTTSSSATPVLLTAVVTLHATLQPNGSVAFGGYPILQFKGPGGQTVNVGSSGAD